MTKTSPRACGSEGHDTSTATDALPGQTPPVACTLGRGEIRARERELRAAFVALVGSVLTDHGFRWAFRDGPGVETKVRQIAAREAACCAFARFDVRRTEGQIVLEVTGPPEARGALEVLRELPSELAEGDDALARVLVGAGLRGR